MQGFLTLGCEAACTASAAFCACCLRKASRAALRWLDIGDVRSAASLLLLYV